MDEDVKGEPRPWNDSRSTKTAPPAASAAATNAATKQKATEHAPTLGERWRKYQPSKSMLLWTAMASIALTILVGFFWGGWVTGSSAEKSASTLAAAAIVQRLAPVCFSQFNLDPDAAAKRTEMAGLTSSQSNKFVQDQGWAIIAGAETADRKVVEACSKLILASGS